MVSSTTTNTSDGENSKSSSYLKGHWRPGEDEKLRQLVKQHGPQNWNSIAEKLQGRSGKSFRLRWFNQLEPGSTSGLSRRRRRSGCWRRTPSTATYGCSSPACSPAAPTTPSRTTSMSSQRAATVIVITRASSSMPPRLASACLRHRLPRRRAYSSHVTSFHEIGQNRTSLQRIAHMRCF